MTAEPLTLPGILDHAMPDLSEAAPTDAQLLGRFLARRVEADFAAMVRRHGPLVLHVCRRVLGDSPEVEDAFQATFLVLIQQAQSVRKHEALSSWLYGVAYRVAARARARMALRRELEGSGSVLPERPTVNADPVEAAGRNEACALLDQELCQLPEKYRAPLVLCYLEGQTTEQAAARLHWPSGTFKSRLARARELLRKRLTRRGLLLSVGAIAAQLSMETARAEVTAALATSTAREAMAFLNGTGTAAIATLANETLRTLGTGAGKLAALLGAGLLAGVATVWFFLSSSFVQPDGQPAANGKGALPVVQGGGTLLVVNQRESTVSLIDVRTGTGRKLKTGLGPHEVALSPNGKTAAVANYGPPFAKAPGNSLTVIGLPEGAVTKTINLGEHTMPHGLAWLDNDRLLCTSEAKQALLVVNVSAGKIEKVLETNQPGSHMVALAADGKRAYTANVHAGTATALDLEQGKKLSDIPAGKGAEGIGISPNGRQLWVVNRADETVTVIDTDNLKAVRTLQCLGMPFRVVLTPDGKFALVTCQQSGDLTIFDANEMKELKRIHLSKGQIVFNTPGPPPGPAAVALSPDGTTAYCSVFLSDAVAVLDLEKGEVIGKLEAGLNPDGIAFSPLTLTVVEDPPASPQVKADPEAVKKEIERFQGVWRAESLVRAGEETIPKEDQKKLILYIQGEERLIKAGEEIRSRGTYKLNPATKPASIDITVSEGALKGKTWKAIYEIDGDTQRICLNLEGDERPKVFASTADNGYLLQVFKRVKK